jgi:hypothetical protein
MKTENPIQTGKFQSRPGVSKESITTFLGIPIRNPAGAMGSLGIYLLPPLFQEL